jgi:hypothetical protein
MKLKVFILSSVAITAVGAVVALVSPNIRFTVHVMGEDGNPLEGVKTTVIFHPGGREDQITQVAVVSDENGNFTAEGTSYDGTFGVSQLLSKDGYYGSGVSIPNHTDKDSLGRWLPWGQTYTTMLRKIGNPISMYAKITDTNIPAIAQPCGYDLVVGDWVGPYGKGRTADFVVTLQRQWQAFNNFDVSVVVTFPDPGSGIQQTQLPQEFSNSQFKWPRSAPENGYQPSLSLHVSDNPTTGLQGDIGDKYANNRYFFRVRTTEQSGNVTSALYGKISEGIELAPNSSKTCGIHLAYYLNPNPNDRNMEYGSTLFKNLDFEETPRFP